MASWLGETRDKGRSERGWPEKSCERNVNESVNSPTKIVSGRTSFREWGDFSVSTSEKSVNGSGLFPWEQAKNS